MTPPKEKGEQPTSKFQGDLVRSIRWFGIWFLVGIAPFLGKIKVPGFSALIELYPSSLQDWLIPLSGILMGMAAVTIEFIAQGSQNKKKLSRLFVRNGLVFAISFVLLLVVYVFTVVHVGRAVERENGPPAFVNLAVITGTRTVPPRFPGSNCTCVPGSPAEGCVSESLDPGNIATCFGSERIAFSTLALVLLYLAVTASFVAAVGLLVIRRRAETGP